MPIREGKRFCMTGAYDVRHCVRKSMLLVQLLLCVICADMHTFSASACISMLHDVH
jgi:hypothetical protein